MIGGGIGWASSTWTPQNLIVHATIGPSWSALMPIFRCDTLATEIVCDEVIWAPSACVQYEMPFACCRKVTRVRRREENEQHHLGARKQERKKKKTTLFFIYDPISVFIGCFSGRNSFTIWWLCEILIYFQLGDMDIFFFGLLLRRTNWCRHIHRQSIIFYDQFGRLKAGKQWRKAEKWDGCRCFLLDFDEWMRLEWISIDVLHFYTCDWIPHAIDGSEFHVHVLN